MGSDPFAPLKTYEDVLMLNLQVASGEAIPEWRVQEALKRHHATWDPETCREMVAILEMVNDAALPGAMRATTALLSRLEDTNAK